MEPLAQKLEAFGGVVRIVDGHNITVLTEVLGQLPFTEDKPSVIIAKTIKGKGISFMENDPKWHHHVPTDEQYERAQQELDRLLREVQA